MGACKSQPRTVGGMIEGLALRCVMVAFLSLASACVHMPSPPREARPMVQVQRVHQDPYRWLEDVDSEPAMAWVRGENERTVAALGSTATFKQTESAIRRALDANDRLPFVQQLGQHAYNFWRDPQNPRGIWRRTTLASYRSAQPAWELMLDLDALNRTEGKAWVWAGASCLPPAYQRCLVSLSPGGTDATITREFDLQTKQWVQGGFDRPLGKGALTWIDLNTVFVATDLGPGTTTSSGYARQVKRWARGTPLTSAALVFEAMPEDLGVDARRDHTPGHERSWVERSFRFYVDEWFGVQPDGSLRKLPVPDSAKKWVWRDWVLLQLREPWRVGTAAFDAGALVAMPFEAWMRGERPMPQLLFQPSVQRSLSDLDLTRHHVVLTVLTDVRASVHVLTPPAPLATNQEWLARVLQGLPSLSRVAVSAVDAHASDALWVTTLDFLNPAQLWWVDASDTKPVDQASAVIKTSPRYFDGNRHVITQRFATSKDGTRVPYFLVAPKGMKFDGTTPTLLYGYGGFEVSQLPHHSVGVGVGWLERGGAYALANIRGGGEYGPRWHQAALKAHRGRSYEDFAAVAQDLVAHGVTSPKRLGVRGGSNGGLLAGNMVVQYPDLIGAASVEVPLLDMRRYTKLLAGASWMAEYGDPDKPEDWAFMQHFSPYHLLDEARRYPPTLLLTSTKDDRVHPGHARKMAALMRASNQAVWYYENIEGGHGGSANNAQAAFMASLTFEFLWRNLALE